MIIKRKSNVPDVLIEVNKKHQLKIPLTNLLNVYVLLLILKK